MTSLGPNTDHDLCVNDLVNKIQAYTLHTLSHVSHTHQKRHGFNRKNWSRFSRLITKRLDILDRLAHHAFLPHCTRVLKFLPKCLDLHILCILNGNSKTLLFNQSLTSTMQSMAWDDGITRVPLPFNFFSPSSAAWQQERQSLFSQQSQSFETNLYFHKEPTSTKHQQVLFLCRKQQGFIPHREKGGSQSQQ